MLGSLLPVWDQEALPSKVIPGQRHASRGHSKCEGPERRACVAQAGSSQEGGVAGAERMGREGAGEMYRHVKMLRPTKRQALCDSTCWVMVRARMY